MPTRRSCFFLLCVTLFAFERSPAALVFATGVAQPLFVMDTRTGSVERLDREPDPQGHLRVSLARNPLSGELLAVNNAGAGAAGIERYLPETGLFETLHAIPPSNRPFHEIAFDSQGRLLGQLVIASVGATGPIGIIGLPSGEFTALTADLPRLFAAGISPENGAFYGITATRDLLEIDTASGAVLSSASLQGNRIGTVGALVFLPDGEAVVSMADAGGGFLASLDLATGMVSNVRPVQDGFWAQGMALVPEPRAILLVVLGAFCAVLRRERPR